MTEYYSLLISRRLPISFFFFFNDTATTEIYTLSLHDALPISDAKHNKNGSDSAFIADHVTLAGWLVGAPGRNPAFGTEDRSEEHTSELQSLAYLVCRLLLEKKKKTHTSIAQLQYNA